MEADRRSISDTDFAPFALKTTSDQLGRTIRYFTTRPPRRAARRIIFFIQGSGCHSVFRLDPAGKVLGGYQTLIAKNVARRASVAVVEKPGVRLFDDHGSSGTARPCSKEFLREHTLPRWRAAIEAAIQAESSHSKPERLLVIGHSEGGIVAASVAAHLPALVSHVAILASSGPTQLFDLAAAARRRARTREAGETATREVFDTYRQIMRRPRSVSDFAWGHPYRRWSSFLRTSTLDELRRSNAAIYLAHGSYDRVVPVAAFDLLLAQLEQDGRDVVADRLDRATHAFRVAGDSDPLDTVRSLYGRVVDWFLDSPPRADL